MGKVNIFKRIICSKVTKVLFILVMICGVGLLVAINVMGLTNIDIGNLGDIESIFKTTVESNENKVNVARGEEIAIGFRDSVQLKVNNATNNVSYESLDKKIVTVDNNGILKPVSVGNARLRVKSGNNEKELSIRVKPYVITLDAGHGGKDDGAAAVTKMGEKILEKDVNLNIAKACKKKLESYGNKEIKVKMTRTNDTFIELIDRANIAEKNETDLNISFHINSNERGGSTGSEVYVSVNKFKSEFNEYSTILGGCIQNKLKANCNIRNGGIKTREDESVEKTLEYYEFNGETCVADYYALIKGPVKRNIPGIIIEHAYMNTASDLSKFDTLEEQNAIGEADAEGIIEYYYKGLMRDIVVKEITL